MMNGSENKFMIGGNVFMPLKMPILLLIIFACVLVFLIATIILRLIMSEELIIRARMNNLISKREQVIMKSKKRKGINLTEKLSPLFKKKALIYLSNELSIAGIPLRADEFLIIWLLLTVIPAGMIFVLVKEPIVALGIAICGMVLPMVFVNRGKAKRLNMLDKQLVDALIIIGNCLKSGLTFQQAMESIARDMPEPISKEFDKVLREAKFGVTFEKALTNMVDRLNNKDVMLLVSAVLIQRQVGGNLSEILGNIAGTIKERIGIKEEVKVLTSTGRASGAVIGLLPVAAFLILMVFNPKYISAFFETSQGTTMLMVAAGMEIIGFTIVSKIVNVKF